LDRLDLIDPSVNLRVEGATSSAAINMGGTGLGVLTKNLTMGGNFTGRDLEVNTHDTFVLNRVVFVDELNLRVFGDQQGVTLNFPVQTGLSIQLVAPDGAVRLPSGTQLNTKTADQGQGTRDRLRAFGHLNGRVNGADVA
ncbi:MAG: hypothetical protein RI963_3436, partial [Planctomycetota bacterium]